MNMASYPNKHYICNVCDKDLGKMDNVNKINSEIYCDKHYEEALDDHVLHAEETDDNIFLQRELLNCKCGGYKIAGDGAIIRVSDCIC